MLASWRICACCTVTACLSCNCAHVQGPAARFISLHGMEHSISLYPACGSPAGQGYAAIRIGRKAFATLVDCMSLHYYVPVTLKCSASKSSLGTIAIQHLTNYSEDNLMPYMLNPLLERGAQSNAHVLHCLSVTLSLECNSGAQWQSFVRQQQETPAAAHGHAPAAIAAPPSPARSPPGPPLGLGGWGADDEGAGAPLALPDPGAPGAPDPGAAGPPGHGMQPAACLPLQARLPAAPDADHSLAHLLQPVISLPLRPQLPAAPSAPHVGMGAGAGAWAQHEPVGFAAGPGSGPAAVAAAHAPAQQQAQAVGVGAPGDITPGYQGPAQVTGPRASAAAARQALMQRFREDSARLDARIRTASAPMQRSLPDPHVRPHAAGAPAGGRPSSTPPVCGIEVPAPAASDQPPAGAASAQPPPGPPSSQQSPAEGLGGWEAQGAGAAAAAAAGEAESSSMLDFLRQNLLAADAGDVELPAAASEGPPRGGCCFAAVTSLAVRPQS